MYDQFEDIEEEILWEKQQKIIATKASEYSKKGMGFKAFKDFIVPRISLAKTEEDLVDDYQTFLLQSAFKTFEEWAPIYYLGNWNVNA